MFKYISDIISKFTQKQRVVALSLLLVTILLMTNGVKIIQLFFHDDTELYSRLELQKKDIDKMSKDYSELNEKYRKSEMSCTDKVIQREKEILEKINELQKNTQSSQLQQVPASGEVAFAREDTIQVREEVRYKRVPDNKSLLMNGLNDIKSNLEKSIESKQIKE